MTANDSPILPEDKERDFDVSENETPSQNDQVTTKDLSMLIDLLVDDELEEQDRKDLLLKLDQAPEGWKMCALAFLEMQMFRRSMRHPDCVGQRSTDVLSQAFSPSANESDAASPSLDRKSPETRRTFLKSGDNWLQWVSVAAISLFAFVLGAVLFSGPSRNMIVSPQGQRHANQNAQPGGTQENSPGAPPLSPIDTTPHLVVKTHPTSNSETGGQVAATDKTGDKSAIAAFTNGSPFVVVVPEKRIANGSLQTVYVTLPDDERSGQMQVPCYLSSEIETEQYLKSPPLIASEELYRIFQTGGDIDVVRETYVVPAGENRQVIIPVDQVIVKYMPQRDVL